MKTIIKYLLFLISITVNAQLVEETTIYSYDNLNRLVKVVFNDGDTKEYVYDNLGNRLQINMETLSIDSETLKNTITVYPNPTNQFININLPETIINQKVEIIIYDINGRELKTNKQQIESTTFSLDVSAFSNGVYLLRILNGDKKWSQLFIKK